MVRLAQDGRYIVPGQRVLIVGNISPTKGRKNAWARAAHAAIDNPTLTTASSRSEAGLRLNIGW